jgi:hypothetical protein
MATAGKMAARRWVVGACLACVCSTPAEAVTVTGTFRYADTTGPMPIRRAVVEIWYHGGGLFDKWGVVGVTRTSSTGRLSFRDERSSGTYSLRIYATNDAVIVYPVDLHFSPYYAVPPDDGQPQFHRVASSARDTLDFSWDFTNSYISREFNLANTAQFGWEYATARRDPMETDLIVQANVQPTSWGSGGTYFNASTNTIMIQDSLGFADRALLHEYGHVLQQHISGANMWASVHDGCSMRLTSGGSLINSPEYAWSEGFAEYYAHAVQRAFGNEPSLNGFATGSIESPPACSVVGAGSQAGIITPAMVESFIASSLWDVVDPVGNPAQGFEGHDTVAGEDATVFRIFDREIDSGPANIFTFRTAWNARGRSLTGLDCILSFYGIVPAITGCRPGALKLAGDFDNDGKTDIALTAPGWSSIPVAFSNGDGRFNVTNSAAATFVSMASSPGAVKLTGDFDGDGDTDIALSGGLSFTGIPVALSNRDGSFTVANNATAAFHSIAANPENRKLVGDFDGNGTSDIALVGAPGFNSVAVAFGRRNPAGTFNVTVNPLGSSLGIKAAVARATIVPGDFTGEGLCDFLVLLPDSEWIALAASNGDGTFTVSDIYGGEFGRWITLPGVKLLTGDFNGDRTTDLALTGVAGWGSVPMLLSSAGVVNAPAADFASWAATSGAIPLVGDFNGGGASDIALTGPVGWNTLPVAIGNSGSWNVRNPLVGDFASWSSTPGATPIVGDFNGDGKTDVALTGGAGWTSVPVAFSGALTNSMPNTVWGGGSGFLTAEPDPFVPFTVTNQVIANFGAWAATVQ